MKTMTHTELIELIDGPYNKMKKWVEDFDRQSSSINQWQNLLGYPLEPHSCQICHTIRNKIMSAINMQDKGFSGISKMELEDVKKFITLAEPIRQELSFTYPKIKKLLYENN